MKWNMFVICQPLKKILKIKKMQFDLLIQHDILPHKSIPKTKQKKTIFFWLIELNNYLFEFNWFTFIFSFFVVATIFYTVENSVMWIWTFRMLFRKRFSFVWEDDMLRLSFRLIFRRLYIYIVLKRKKIK